MAKKSLEDQRYELIKAHCLNPANSPLSEADQVIFNRVISIARELDIYPARKLAVNAHMQKYPEISRSQAYDDCNMAMRVFNTAHDFDFDRWHEWLLNDICELIKECKTQKEDPKALRAWALAHSNLIKALGEKPVAKIDPKLVEKHNFILPIVINNVTYNFNLQKFLNLPAIVQKKVTDAMITDITEEEAKDIMNS